MSGWWFVVQCLLGGNNAGRIGSASSRRVTRVARLGTVATGGRDMRGTGRALFRWR